MNSLIQLLFLSFKILKHFRQYLIYQNQLNKNNINFDIQSYTYLIVVFKFVCEQPND